MNKKISVQIFLVNFIFLPVIGQNVKTGADTSVHHKAHKSFNLFTDDKLLEISLKFDLGTYFRTKPKPNYLKAEITFHLGEKDSINKEIGLRTRGIDRNRRCTFAPIELNFKKVDFGYSDLNKISKLKLVPECSSTGEYEDYVLREYLIYKLFNVLTDTSFRVRLVSVNYIDSQKKRKPVKQYGFFIEPVAMLTARTNTVPIYVKTVRPNNIVPKVMDRLAIFNYMIGNFDWSVQGQHNVRIIKSPSIDTVQLGIAVPYDFDWSGVVNASYAIPAEDMGINSVRERKFLGACRTRGEYLKDLDLFLEKKQDFYRVINEFPYLSQRSKKDIITFLNDFFDMSVGKKPVINTFLNNCKKFKP
jgi:hypothetical protein